MTDLGAYRKGLYIDTAARALGMNVRSVSLSEMLCVTLRSIWPGGLFKFSFSSLIFYLNLFSFTYCWVVCNCIHVQISKFLSSIHHWWKFGCRNKAARSSESLDRHTLIFPLTKTTSLWDSGHQNLSVLGATALFHRRAHGPSC